MDLVLEAVWGAYEQMGKDTCLVFDSLTGTRELWDREAEVWRFYQNMCPKLYELNTISYWLVKQGALSSKLQARINNLAQVVMSLSVGENGNYLTVIKADGRSTDLINQKHKYCAESGFVTFDGLHKSHRRVKFSLRFKEARELRGLSQRELARLAGVTASTISQIESDKILPSMHTLFKIADVLALQPSFFFQDQTDCIDKLVFSQKDAKKITINHIPENSPMVRAFTPLRSQRKVQVYLVEIPPSISFSPHFVLNKGEEVGCLLSGKLRFWVAGKAHNLKINEVAYLTTQAPEKWENIGNKAAKLLWMTID
jgi:transcriptional regulator with XRE-family HTH domain